MAALTNEITRAKFSAGRIFIRQFKNPLLLVFIISTVVAYLVGEKSEALVIWIVMSISIILGFWNEYQAEKIVNDLVKRVSFTVSIIRDGVKKVISVREIIVNDEVTILAKEICPLTEFQKGLAILSNLFRSGCHRPLSSLQPVFKLSRIYTSSRALLWIFIRNNVNISNIC